MPPSGDLNAIERIAYEACEDQAKDGVIYFEGRYSPHFFAGYTLHADGASVGCTGEGHVQTLPADVVKAVYRGFQRGERDFKVQARSVLCCIRSHDTWNKEVISLCESWAHLF